MGITYEGATEQVTQIVHRHAVLRRGVERGSSGRNGLSRALTAQWRAAIIIVPGRRRPPGSHAAPPLAGRTGTALAGPRKEAG
jgi:hypothetical protein